MERYQHLKGFDRVAKILSEDRSRLNAFMSVSGALFDAKPDEIRRFDYDVKGAKWTVWESPGWKAFGDEAGTYNEFFDKRTGYTCKFGRTPDEDPEWCQLGPDIADIEVVAGKCPKINGHNCAFCYKNNGGDVANCMTLAQFKELLDFFPKNLCQIAFGITGYYTNPEFPAMMAYARENGVVPNYTTNGVDIDAAAVEHTLNTCGRVAVSCYEGAKDLCYSTLDRFGKAAEKAGKAFPCNIHVVLSKSTYPHVVSVLEDAKEGRIPNLGAVVILRMKPVGRAKALDCEIPYGMYCKIVEFCLKNGVRFGFDSCGATRVSEVLSAIGRPELTECVETCESSRFSAYVNWKREYWNCSFCEGNSEITEAVRPLDFKTFQEFWNSPKLDAVRFPKSRACASCPWYKLD